MNFTVMNPYEDQAIDLVVQVINDAKFHMGFRQDLDELADSPNEFYANKIKVPLHSLMTPLAKTTEKLIINTIERKWKLTSSLKYFLRYAGSSQDECSHCYYYEAVFSQPTVIYPIPQAVASVIFRVQEKHIEPPLERSAPHLSFRVEGATVDHDIRFVALTADWLLGLIQTKIRFFKRIEALDMF